MMTPISSRLRPPRSATMRSHWSFLNAPLATNLEHVQESPGDQPPELAEGLLLKDHADVGWDLERLEDPSGVTGEPGPPAGDPAHTMRPAQDRSLGGGDLDRRQAAVRRCWRGSDGDNGYSSPGETQA
jgi:hypothetical protein